MRAFDKLTEKLTISRTITQKVMREKVAILSQDAKTDAAVLRSGFDRLARCPIDDLRSAYHASRMSTACFTRTGSIRLRRSHPTILS